MSSSQRARTAAASSSSRSASCSSALAQRVAVALRDVGHEAVGGQGGIRSALRTCAGDSPASSASATSIASRRRRPSGRAGRSAARPAAQLEVAAWSRRPSPATSASPGSSLALGRGGRQLVDLLGPDAAPGAELEASFSSSRSSRCWRSPTCATSARARLRVELEAESLRPGRHPFGQLPGFTVASAATCAAGRLTALRSAAGTLARPPRAPKNATVVSGGIAAKRASRSSRSASFQRSTPSTITKRRPSAKRHRPQRGGRGLRRPPRPRGPRPRQRRSRTRPARAGGAALGDPAVVVAVDQVGGAEGGHAAARVRCGVRRGDETPSSRRTPLCDERDPGPFGNVQSRVKDQLRRVSRVARAGRPRRETMTDLLPRPLRYPRRSRPPRPSPSGGNGGLRGGGAPRRDARARTAAGRVRRRGARAPGRCWRRRPRAMAPRRDRRALGRRRRRAVPRARRAPGAVRRRGAAVGPGLQDPGQRAAPPLRHRLPAGDRGTRGPRGGDPPGAGGSPPRTVLEEVVAGTQRHAEPPRAGGAARAGAGQVQPRDRRGAVAGRGHDQVASAARLPQARRRLPRRGRRALHRPARRPAQAATSWPAANPA